jgi:hypothetical protein
MSEIKIRTICFICRKPQEENGKYFTHDVCMCKMMRRVDKGPQEIVPEKEKVIVIRLER